MAFVTKKDSGVKTVVKARHSGDPRPYVKIVEKSALKYIILVAIARSLPVMLA